MPISLDTSTLTSPLADAVVRTPISTTPIYAPFTILIDRDGKVIATNLRGAALEQTLQQIFGF